MLTVDQLRQRITTSLGSDALAGFLTAAYEAIDAHIGPAGPVTELLTADSGDLLVLSRGAASVTRILENDVELDPLDYTLISPTLLRRLRTGPHPSSRWRGRAQPTYQPFEDEAERDRIATELVRLDVTHAPGLSSQRLGDWSESYSSGNDSYPLERQAILDSYGSGGGAFI